MTSSRRSTREHRIFLKTGESPRIEYPLALGREAESKSAAFQPAQRLQPARDAQRQADHILLARYAPPGVVVNERLEVVQFRGRTGDFLEPPPGQPQTNVLKMAREGLVGHLREALETAKSQSITVRRQGVRITEDAEARSINLEVVPLAGVATKRSTTSSSSSRRSLPARAPERRPAACTPDRGAS